MPHVCDYEGSDYQQVFWTEARQYENLAERQAVRKLLPPTGDLLVEIGAGFGRLADLYAGYKQIVLLDYAESMLRQAQERWGHDPRFRFVQGDVYRLPLRSGRIDTVVMVRVMHHLQDVPAALREINRVARGAGHALLEYANKRNLKAIARYWAGQQKWSPFAEQPYEFVPLNFDFHPGWMAQQLRESGWRTERELAVSHFRWLLMKKVFPATWLAWADDKVQGIGALWKLTPSLFVRAAPTHHLYSEGAIFRCPVCGCESLSEREEALHCPQCKTVWPIENGIIKFRS